MDAAVLFGRYRLVEPAGSGGTAQVWRAVDEVSGEEVALKRLHPIVFGSEGGRQRLVREFGALRGLRHPAVVRVRALEMGRDEAALVLDYVPGTSLRARLAAGGRLAPPEVGRIILDLAGALAAAHTAGIVHGDVSPGNVLLGKDGRARLTDFGIAHEATRDTAAETGMVTGTLRYISPEQLRGWPATPRSDLYGLAAVAYEMLAGRPPFAATTPVALVEAQRTGPRRIAGLDPAVDRVARRGLALAPGARPPSVEAFADALAAGLGSDPDESPGQAAVPVAVGAALALGALILIATAIGGPAQPDFAAGAASASPRASQAHDLTEGPPANEGAESGG